MSEILSKVQTRGRPRKKTEQKLPPISRKLFSEHCAVFYACCMVYVLEVFLKTKQEKRIGHSQGGFTIYEKLHVNPVYCFETFEDDIKEWGFQDEILRNRDLNDFARTTNGCAPKFVFRELVTLFTLIHRFIEEEGITTIEELDSSQCKLLNIADSDLNRMFKYIRFDIQALKELKMEKWDSEVAQKIQQLWRPFLKVVSYTVFCVEKGVQKNRYLRPFFSDAEHPEQTIIGQLNLKQIVDDRQDKTISSSSNLGFTKIDKGTDEGDKSNNFALEKGCSHSSMFNKRPVTLITFPSNPKLEMASPCKPSTTGQGIRSFDELDQISPPEPMKRQKKDE